MLELTTPEPITDEDGEEIPPARVDLFSIDGTTYTMEGGLNASLSLRYLHAVRVVGLMAATDWLLEEALGVEGYEALVGWRHITAEQVATVVAAIKREAFGEVDTPAGKGGGRASTRKKPVRKRTR